MSNRKTIANDTRTQNNTHTRPYIATHVHVSLAQYANAPYIKYLVLDYYRFPRTRLYMAGKPPFWGGGFRDAVAWQHWRPHPSPPCVCLTLERIRERVVNMCVRTTGWVEKLGSFDVILDVGFCEGCWFLIVFIVLIVQCFWFFYHES